MSATPAQYNRQANFVTEAQGNANITVSQIAVELDAEFDALNVAVDQTQSRLAEIQRDDGALRNGIVTSEALSPGAFDTQISNYTTFGTATPMTRWSLAPNGTTTTFPLLGATLDQPTSYLVTVDGVTQDPASYTTPSGSIVFSEAPPSGSQVTVVCLGYQRAIVTPNIGAGSISTVLIADDAITTAKIAPGAVVTADLADGAVTSAKIADGAVATVDIADSAVTTAKIADSAITTAKIAAGAVVTADLADGAVTTAKIAAGAVGTSLIADAAVTTEKIAVGAVVTVDLADSAVSTAKIADSAVSTVKIANNAVTAAKLGTNEQKQICKAWVNFNGSTGAIRASYNVSSITRNAVGDYTVSFSNALASADYTVATAAQTNTNAPFLIANFGGSGGSSAFAQSATTTAYRFALYNYNYTGVADSAFVTLQVFGN